MVKRQSRGTCFLCESSPSKGGMTKHLKSCIRKNLLSTGRPRKKGACYHMVISGQYFPDYWIHLAVPVNTTLQKLDQALREVWLECCGHGNGIKG